MMQFCEPTVNLALSKNYFGSGVTYNPEFLG